MKAQIPIHGQEKKISSQLNAQQCCMISSNGLLRVLRPYCRSRQQVVQSEAHAYFSQRVVTTCKKLMLVLFGLYLLSAVLQNPHCCWFPYGLVGMYLIFSKWCLKLSKCHWIATQILDLSFLKFKDTNSFFFYQITHLYFSLHSIHSLILLL